jgi:ribosome-associated heat shock protein Hsp15
MSRIESGPAEEWQRLDLWLWCARIMKGRSGCASLIASGAVRLNGQSTEKAHSRVRIGDIIVLGLKGQVRVLCVSSLAKRRGSPSEARALYAEVFEDVPKSSDLLEDGRDVCNTETDR